MSKKKQKTDRQIAGEILGLCYKLKQMKIKLLIILVAHKYIHYFFIWEEVSKIFFPACINILV